MMRILRIFREYLPTGRQAANIFTNPAQAKQVRGVRGISA